MKLTESQLRRIIRNEARTTIKESTRSHKRSLVSLIFEENENSEGESSEDKKVDKGGDKKVDPAVLPMKLSQVDAEFAKKLVASGDKNIDKINVKKGDVGSCSSLKPSQTTMNIHKALQFALGMMNGTMFGSGGPGGDLNCFVSADNYIMDGHHRWIASAMVDPGSKLEGYKADLNGKELLSVLNTITKGMFSKDKGNQGSGGFEQFKDKQALLDALDLQLKGEAPTYDGKSTQGPAGGKPDQIQGLIEKFSGEKGEAAKEATVDKWMKNMSACKTSEKDILPGAPGREDMPVIDGAQNQKAADALNAGEVDAFPPYAAKESFSNNGSVIVERWQKLAGLIK